MPQVVNIGSSTTVVGGTVTITIGAGGVPAGAHIVIAVSWNLTVNQPTITDTAGNTYLISGNGTVKANNNITANGAGGVFRERTGLALVNGNTIVVTLDVTSTAAAVDAFYVTGLLNTASDTAAFGVNSGSSANPTGTSGTPVAGGELFVAIVTGASLVTSFTQDTTNAAWGTSPPSGSISNAAPVLGVGIVYNSGSGTLTYAPTFGSSDAWAVTIVGYITAPAPTPPPWKFGYSDDSVWQAASSPKGFNLSLAVANVFAKTVLRPPLYAPRIFEEAQWNNVSRRAATISLPVVAATQPPTKMWHYDFDDAAPVRIGNAPLNLSLVNLIQTPAVRDSFANSLEDTLLWQSAPRRNLSLVPVVVVATPFVNPPWKFGLDDSSGWQSGPKPRNVNLVPAVVSEPFIYTPWNGGGDDAPNWKLALTYNGALLAPSTFKTVLRPPFYTARPAEETYWRLTSERNTNLFAPVAVATNPFIPQRWKFGQGDDTSWALRTPFNFALVSGLQFPIEHVVPFSPPDDLPPWQQPFNRSLSLFPATADQTIVRSPFIVSRPVDDAYWQVASSKRNLNLVPVVTASPFGGVPWKFNIDEPSVWQAKAPFNFPLVVNIQFPPTQLGFYGQPEDTPSGQPTRGKNINLVPAIVVEPFIYNPWKFGLDDSSGWQSGPKGRNPNLVPAPSPFIYTPWKFNYDDSSGWQFGPKGSTLLVPIVTAGGQTSAPAWKFVTRPFDDPVWQFVGQVNINVTNRPTIVLPPIRNWIYGSSVPTDQPAWQGFYWRNSAILFPLPPYITDPRFVSSPFALNAVLPSNRGSGRIFVTTPKVPGMPYGNDFPAIDPQVERVTATFNFDPWLGIGVTVTSVVSVTASVAQRSLTQDAAPQAIISGVPQIGPVPPMFPGVPAGLPGRAVLQQIANTQAGVTYLLQCLVLTSDGQELNLATHLPCNALN